MVSIHLQFSLAKYKQARGKVLPESHQPCFTGQKLRHTQEDRRKEGVATAEKRNLKASEGTSPNTCLYDPSVLHCLIPGHASLCGGDLVIQTDFVLSRSNYEVVHITGSHKEVLGLTRCEMETSNELSP